MLNQKENFNLYFTKLNIILYVLTLFIIVPMFSQNGQYERGYYLDSVNNKIDGYIKIINGSTIKFKNKNQEEKLILDPDAINGFNVNGFNYRVINNFKAKSDNVLAYKEYSSGFAKEIILGDISLFSYIITTNNGTYYEDSEYYFILKKTEKTPVQVFTGNKKFRRQMSELMKDKRFNSDKFDFNKIKYQDIESIIKQYNEL